MWQSRYFLFPDGFINYHMIISTPVSDHLLFLRRPDGMGNLTYADNTGTWARTNSPMDSLPWTIVKYNPGGFIVLGCRSSGNYFIMTVTLTW
jgi:hypothetical protein